MKGYGIIEGNELGWIEIDEPIADSFDAICKPIALCPSSMEISALKDNIDAGLSNGILGRSCVGEVVEIGNSVDKFKPGDKVIVSTKNNGNNNSLQERSKISFGNEPTNNSDSIKQGVFAQRFSVNNADRNLIKLPEKLSIASALMACDVMEEGFFAAEIAEIVFGDTILVLGSGAIGLMAIAGARVLGGGRIFISGFSKNSVDLAIEYGATDIIADEDGDFVEQILDKNGGPVDCVIIADTSVNDKDSILRVVKPNGTISSIVLPGLENLSITNTQFGFGMNDLKLRSKSCPGGVAHIEKMLNIIQFSSVDSSKLINYEFEGFSKIEDAFKLINENPEDLIKVAVFINDIQ